MSTIMQVKESETGLVRLFAVDLAPQAALSLREKSGMIPALLGVEALRDDQWELFDLSDLAGLGLEGYLSDGHGIAEADLTPHRWSLDALEGVVLLLRSAAMPDRPVTLTPRAPLRWVATFGELKAPVPLRSDLASKNATGTLGVAPEETRSPRTTWVVLVLGLLMTAAIALTIVLITRGPT